MNSGKLAVRSIQAAIVTFIILAWEFVPRIPGLSDRWVIFDPFFVSSPSRVATELWELTSGANDTALIWPFLRETVQASLIGTAIGIVTGAAAGLILSGSENLAQILRPFIVAANATPRIALIPIVVIIFGPTTQASIVTAVLVVFFVVFFNAYEGGRSVRAEVVENAELLGGQRMAVLRYVRLPYVMAWTFAALPTAVTFGLISVVTAEILTGYAGLGRLLIVAINSASSSLTFAVVVFLAVLGLALVIVSEALRGRVLHWWEGGRRVT